MRAERERKDQSLGEIAARIKIREEHLHNLEEGYYDSLPPEVYTKGFLKTYAEYLGLNADKLLPAVNLLYFEITIDSFSGFGFSVGADSDHDITVVRDGSVIDDYLCLTG